MAITILDIISPKLAEEVGLTNPPKEAVEFRLLNAGRVDPSSIDLKTSTPKVASPQAYIFPGQDYIVDPYDKNARQKLVMNITGYNSIKGKPGEGTYLDPIIDFVRFSSEGSIWVQPEDFNLLAYLRVNNRNRDFPHRKGNKAPRYYEVNEKKEIEAKNNLFIYTYLASSLLMDLDSTQIKEIAEKVERAYPSKYIFRRSQEPAEILLQLENITKQNPLDIILAVKEPRTYARVLVDDAVNRKLIFFDDHAEKLQWAWKRAPAEKGKRNIVKLAAGNNSVNGLIDFLTTAEGNEHFIELKQLNEEHYRPR